uniref:Uncharacterized protein n=1 Tax=Arundo donax TaxID=35708 RepID=A0A0A8ZZX2_ARUDO
MNPASSKQSSPYTNISFQWHALDKLISFVKEATSCQKVNHADIVLHPWKYTILMCHRMKPVLPFSHKSRMAARRY